MRKEKMRRREYIIESGYLAKALAFIGFRYDTRVRRDKILYIFEDTETLRNYLGMILHMQDTLRK